MVFICPVYFVKKCRFEMLQINNNKGCKESTYNKKDMEVKPKKCKGIGKSKGFDVCGKLSHQRTYKTGETL